jgi:hypothetical protein
MAGGRQAMMADQGQQNMGFNQQQSQFQPQQQYQQAQYNQPMAANYGPYASQPQRQQQDCAYGDCQDGPCEEGQCQGGNCSTSCGGRPRLTFNLPAGGNYGAGDMVRVRGMNRDMQPQAVPQPAPQMFRQPAGQFVNNPIRQQAADDQEVIRIADLQIMKVELIDGGDGQNMGPTIRVAIRNNGYAPAEGFDIALVVTNGQDPSPRFPFVNQRVDRVEAMNQKIVDIRLPAVASRMHKTADGQVEPFTTLFVALDAQQEIQEQSKQNNTARLDRSELSAAGAVASEF